MGNTELFRRTAVFRRIDDLNTELTLFWNIKIIVNMPIERCIQSTQTEAATEELIQEIGKIRYGKLV